MSLCGKVVYGTRSDAKRAAREIKGQGKRKTTHKLQPYRCWICCGWHLTSQPNVREKKSE